MRKRNNKINIFLNDEENEILKSNTKKLKISQSEYIRNLILKTEFNTPILKEETKNNSDGYIIKNVIKVLEENIEYLIKVKNKFHYLGYFQDEELIKTKIESLKTLNNSIKK